MSYGKSIKLNNMFDFTFNPATNTLVLSNETENLVQAITIILKTMIGELRTFPTFGIDIPSLFDRTMSNDNIKYYIKDAIIRDPRVKSIDKIELIRGNRVLDVNISLTSITGASLDYRESLAW
jgi:phage baseplate assembly protein W